MSTEITKSRPRHLDGPVCIGSFLSMAGTLWLLNAGGTNFGADGPFAMIVFFFVLVQSLLLLGTAVVPMLYFRSDRGFRLSNSSWVIFAISSLGLAVEVTALILTPSRSMC